MVSERPPKRDQKPVSRDDMSVEMTRPDNSIQKSSQKGCAPRGDEWDFDVVAELGEKRWNRMELKEN